MKKEMLVSALLLANPLAALANSEIAAIRSAALESGRDLIMAEFKSAKTYHAILPRWNEATGMSEDVKAEVYLRVTFRAAGLKDTAYTFNGQGVLDYEAVVECVNIATGEAIGSDNTYYVKKESGSKFRFFDCDSTRRCDTEYSNTKAYVFNSEQGKVLKIKNTDVSLPYVPQTDKEVVFFEVK